jgi:hypothetical protein
MNAHYRFLPKWSVEVIEKGLNPEPLVANESLPR